jgi:hypothetical protein
MIRCIRVLSLEDLSCLALLDCLLRHTFVPRIRYLGFTTRRKKGPLTTTGDLSACKSTRTLIQQLTVNKPLFLAPLPGNKWSRFDLLLFFCEFQFSFKFFFFHLLNFDHPQNKSNLVCLTLVFLDLFLLLFLHILFIANPNKRWTTTSPTNPKILWMIQKNFTG